MRTGWFAALAALALLAAPLAAGTALAADDGVYRLGEVVVSGQETGVEAIGTTAKVTAEEIETRGARTLDEAIDLLPGVNIRTGGDGAPRIDMRGLRTRNVKLLLNGTPYNSSYDGQFDPSLIAVENIAEIVVTTGGGSELYGSGGNGGVINIITKKGVQGAHGSAGVELIENDAHRLRATASYGGEKYDVFVSSSLYDRDYFELSNHFSETDSQGNGERENSDRERKDVFANVGFNPTESTLLGFTLGIVDGERGKPHAIVKDDYSSQKFERIEDEDGLNVQLVLDQKLTDALSLRSWAYFNSLDEVEKRYDDDSYSTQAKNGAFTNDSTTEISGVNAQLRYDMQQRGAVTFGLMAENNDYEADGFEVTKSGTNDIDVDEDFQLYSASLEYEVSPLQNLGVVLGAGYHIQDRDGGSENDYTYLIGLSYDLREGTRLKASHSRKVRFPTLSNLYDPDKGNTDLEAEVTKNYEAGIEQDLPAKIMMSVTGFYIDAEDFIEKPDGSDFVQNFDEYEFYGVEVAAENRYFQNLFLRASYSYLQSENKDSDSEIDELQNRPEHKTTLEALYQLPWGLSAYGSVLYVAKNYYYNKNDNTDQKRLPEYVVADFKLNKSVAGGALDLYIGVDNLFDEDYEQSYAIPMAGRTYYGGVNWKF